MLYTHNFACREANESTSESTDEDLGWGGLGKFEYGKKGSARGLVHAIVHVRELLETGGHHGAFCTSLAEAAHKQGIKRAAQFSRVYRSLNTTQEAMLHWVLRQTLFEDVFLVHKRVHHQGEVRQASPVSVRSTLYKFGSHLNYTDDWRDLPLYEGDLLPLTWRSTFLSNKVLISREELLVFLRTKLQMQHTLLNLQFIRKNLRIRCFGSVTIPLPRSGNRRKIVGIDSTNRRDFVRTRGCENNTALACQVRVDTQLNTYTCILLAIHVCAYTHSCA